MSTLRVNTIQDSTGSSSPAINGLAKAWVNFNGQNTVAIRAALNVSSITDLATGRYIINFNTAMPDTNYATVFGTGDYNASWNGGQALGRVGNSTKATTGIHLHLSNNTFSDYDFEEISITVFR